jgi:ketosteroid isomerase-like protein
MTTSTTITGVVEQILDHAANGCWDALRDVLNPSFEIIEPDSLPYGGAHRGAEGYMALMQRIGDLFDLEFAPDGLHALSDTTVLLRMHVTFTARATGRSTHLPILELLTVEDARVTRSHVFISDTAALLRTLDS